MACRVTPDPLGQQADGLLEVKELGTRTRDLLALSDWLSEAGVTHVALESTGESWKPVYHPLEGAMTVFLVNATHVTNVPGRQTDRADARWLAKLRRHGLLPASVIPAVEQRDRRDLTRDRTKLVPERTRKVTRVQGVLERANIKVASVASEMMGVSGQAILAALREGRADPATRAELAKGRVRSMLPLLEQALTGLVRAHHRQFLARQLAHLNCLDEQIETLRADITRLLSESRATPPTPPPAASVGATRAVGRVGLPSASPHLCAGGHGAGDHAWRQSTGWGTVGRGVGDRDGARWSRRSPGAESRRAMTKARAHNAPGRPARATAPSARA
jgi:hypothetical protein